MVEEDPKVKAIVFECTLLPAYAYAVQEAVNLPIFDHSTLINFVYSSIVRKYINWIKDDAGSFLRVSVTFEANGYEAKLFIDNLDRK